MVWKTAFLSIALILSLAKVSSASPTSENAKGGNNLDYNSSFHVLAQANQEAEEIILILGLTDEQIAQLVQIDNQFNPQLEELYPAWDTAQEELEMLIQSETASEDEVRSQYEAVESLRRQVSELQFERRMAIREILRPEQREPYAQYLEQRIANGDS